MFCDRRHNAFIASVLNASPSIIVRFSSSGTGHARPVSLRHLTIAGAATPDVSYIGPAYARISASLALATDLAAGVGVRLASAPFGVTVSEVIPADPDARTEERYDDGDTAEAARAMVCHKRDMPEIPYAIVAGCSARPGRQDEGWSKGEISRPLWRTRMDRAVQLAPSLH